MFSVRVDKVAVQNRVGKSRRSRMRRTTAKAWKKAIVTLKPEFKINLF
jgi:ribosomal protein L23